MTTGWIHRSDARRSGGTVHVCGMDMGSYADSIVDITKGVECGIMPLTSVLFEERSEIGRERL